MLDSLVYLVRSLQHVVADIDFYCLLTVQLYWLW